MRAEPSGEERSFFEAAEGVFREAMGTPAGGRAGLIASRCGGDRALAEEVERLLRAAEGPDPFPTGGASLEAELGVAGLGVAGEDGAGGVDGAWVGGGSIAAGARVGRYVVERLIGEGGFGEVYLARQEEPLERRVALKVIRPWLGGARVLERFERERRALAVMDHPGIARIYDAGMTGDGRPYFAMEYVEGEAIDVACDRLGLGLRERVRLAAGVAWTLHHAHQKGVIHRDVKPSNVLVSEVDGELVAKLIDFGVATAVESEEGAGTRFTAEGSLIGTPEFMSPEQAAGERVDTRSDVYSLGVVAYVLLTGQTPFEWGRERRAAVHEVLRRVREEESPLASERVRRLGVGAREAAARRGLEPGRLAARLSGDLDWVLRRAMEKAPERRYNSAAALATDLERYLSRRAVEAGPPSVSYRLRKFASRHRGLVAGVGVGGAAVVLGLAGTTAGFLRAEAALRREREQAGVTAALNAFFTEDVLAAADPWVNPEPDMTIAGAVERAALGLEGRFEGRPLIEATIRGAVGNIYNSLGRWAEAEAELVRAIGLFDRHAGRSSAESGAARLTLGVVLTSAGRYAEARPVVEEALAVLEERGGMGAHETQDAAIAMVHLLVDMAEFEEAERLAAMLIELVDTGVAVPSLAVTMLTAAGAVEYKQDRFDEARALNERALELSDRVFGADHPESNTIVGNLALISQRSGSMERAAELYERAVAYDERTIGRDHPTAMTGRNNYGLLLRDLGRHEEAHAILSEILEKRLEVFGQTHPDTMVSMMMTATNLSRMGRFEEAEALALRGSGLLDEHLGREHPYSRVGRQIVVSLYERWGRAEEAAAWREAEGGEVGGGGG